MVCGVWRVVCGVWLAPSVRSLHENVLHTFHAASSLIAVMASQAILQKCEVTYYACLFDIGLTDWNVKCSVNPEINFGLFFHTKLIFILTQSGLIVNL